MAKFQLEINMNQHAFPAEVRAPKAHETTCRSRRKQNENGGQQNEINDKSTCVRYWNQCEINMPFEGISEGDTVKSLGNHCVFQKRANKSSQD